MRGDSTRYAKKNINNNTNMDDKRRLKKPKVSTIQKKYYTSPKTNTSHSSSTYDDLEKYINKVTEKTMKELRKGWKKSYSEKFQNTYPQLSKKNINLKI